MSPIKVGVVGLSATGWASTALAPSLLASPAYSLTAVSTTSSTSADASAKKYSELTGHPVKPFHGDTSSIAKDADVDLVAVSVKAPQHKAAALPIIEAGKDIFIEWPAGRNLQETIEIAAAAKTKGVKSIVGLQSRQAPVVKKIKEILESGKIGEVRSSSIIAVVARELAAWGPIVSEHHLYTVEKDAGVTLLDIGLGHFLDTVTHLLGDYSSVSATATQQYPSSTVVDADGKPTGQVVTSNSPNQIAFTGIFKSGAISSGTWHAGLPSTKGRKYLLWEIDGEGGSIRVEGDSMMEAFLAGGNPKLYLNGEPVEIPQVSGMSDNLTSAWEAFAKDGGYPTLEDAVKNRTLLAAISRSAEEGRVITL